MDAREHNDVESCDDEESPGAIVSFPFDAAFLNSSSFPSRRQEQRVKAGRAARLFKHCELLANIRPGGFLRGRGPRQSLAKSDRQSGAPAAGRLRAGRRQSYRSFAVRRPATKQMFSATAGRSGGATATEMPPTSGNPSSMISAKPSRRMDARRAMKSSTDMGECDEVERSAAG
uniref:Uncharacterized protein n=1 Tax=Bosea sp. NBC_00436 TaxID=2969620 RepID=A0A9E8A3Y9_9HYPH